MSKFIFPCLVIGFSPCSGHLRDEAKIADLVLSVFRSNELLIRMTRQNPLYGVLQIKDEVYTPVSMYSEEKEGRMSLLPLITYVVKNIQSF